jgi:hypothetical protein
MVKQRGAIMWDAIISQIYHQSRRSYVAAIVAAITLASASANAGQSRSLSLASSEPASAAAVEQPKVRQTADAPASAVELPKPTAPLEVTKAPAGAEKTAEAATPKRKHPSTEARVIYELHRHGIYW